MYREQPDEGKPDSGWRFFAGDENEDYTEDELKENLNEVTRQKKQIETIEKLDKQIKNNKTFLLS